MILSFNSLLVKHKMIRNEIMFNDHENKIQEILSAFQKKVKRKIPFPMKPDDNTSYNFVVNDLG